VTGSKIIQGKTQSRQLCLFLRHSLVISHVYVTRKERSREQGFMHAKQYKYNIKWYTLIDGLNMLRSLYHEKK
jgi:hypothetical protein